MRQNGVMDLRQKRYAVIASLTLAAGTACYLLWTVENDRWLALMTQAADENKAGRYERALAAAEEALRIAERRTFLRSADTSRSLAMVASQQRHLGRLAQAEVTYLRAIEVGKRSSLDPVSAAEAECELGDLYRDRMEFAKAGPLFHSGLAAIERHRERSETSLGMCLYKSALLDQNLMRGAAAEDKFRRALGILEKSLGPTHVELGTLHAFLGSSALDRRAYGEAEEHCARSLAIYRERLPAEHPYVAHALASLGSVYSLQGRHAQAEMLLRQSLDLTDRAGQRDHWALARVLSELGTALMMQGRLDEAEPMLEQAAAIYRKALGPHSPYVTAVERIQDDLYRSRSRAR